MGQSPPEHHKACRRRRRWVGLFNTRREEVVLARLRMGSTLPTHMLPCISHSFPPQCPHCNVTLSVDHILIHCVRFRKARRSLAAYCVARRLPVTKNTLLGDDPDMIDRLMIFLTDTNLISELWLTYIKIIHYVYMHRICFSYCTCFVNIVLVWMSVWWFFAWLRIWESPFLPSTCVHVLYISPSMNVYVLLLPSLPPWLKTSFEIGFRYSRMNEACEWVWMYI